jgi:hypothetical protein
MLDSNPPAAPSGVRINEATVDEICALPGIGRVRAARVVQDREANGFFRSAQDLRRALPANIADTVADSIDWRLPTQEAEAEGSSSRSMFGAGCAVTVIAFGCYLFVKYLGFANEWLAFSSGFDRAFVGAWTNGSVAAIGVVLMIHGTFGVVLSLSKTPRWERVGIKGLLAATVLMGLGLVSLGIANFVRYQVYDGWPELLRNHAAVVGLVVSITSAGIYIIPPLIVYWRPALVESRALAITVNVLWILYLPLLAYALWTQQELLPAWALLLAALQGGLFAVVGVWVLSQGGSILQITLAAMLGSVRRTSTERRDELVAWLNVRMPKEAEQKELLGALNSRYPKTRGRLVMGWLVTTLGSAVALGAVKGVAQSVGVL